MEITHQTEFIGIRALTQVLEQVPIWHPRIYKGERRGIGAEPEEPDHIRVFESFPHYPTGT